jgi:hypothetical protein
LAAGSEKEQSMCQQILDFLYNIALNLFLIIVGIVLALWYENLGAPKLKISGGSTTDSTKENVWRTRFLHLVVKNEPRKRWWFVIRQTAFSCHGTITFLTSNNKQIGNPMPIRWDGNPEPLIPEIVKKEIKFLPDFRLIRLSRFIDIPADESESLAIAVRINDDLNAYGWTGESYLHNWRHPEYQLPTGEYIARISLTTGDSVFKQDFRFTNTEQFEFFDFVS